MSEPAKTDRQLAEALVNVSKKPEIVGYLMNYKNASIGFTETDYEL